MQIMTKEDDAILVKRKALLDVVYTATRGKHDKRSKELSGQARKAELILIAWGFLFAGIAGFYQADILDKDNLWQLILLLLPMGLSLIICVKQVMFRQSEDDVPRLSELWTQYMDSYSNGYSEYDEVTAKEQLIQSYIDAEEKNRIKLGKKAYSLTIASSFIVIEVALLLLFILLTPHYVYIAC